MSDAPPPSIGRYRCVALLGRGGEGEVWAAEHHGPGGMRRTVALKLVHDGARSRREARLGGLLRHPHLVDVYEVGEADGRGWLAMELCADGSLAGRGPLPLRAVVEVGLQVCAALAYAHTELGLVHADLKPENLLLDGPVVKVADLGIARVAADGAPERVAGTVGYMSPEQRRGAPLDPRADVYALGVVLRVLATGHLGAGSATLSLDALDDDPDEVAGELDPALAPIVERCLAPDPDDRFPSMRDLAAALAAVDATGPSLAEALHLATPTPAPAGELTDREALPWVGRVDELDRVTAALREADPVTLVGAPGVGKSLVAREAARRHRAGTGAVAVWCDLSEARDEADLVVVVARSLGVPLGTGDVRAHAERVARALGSRGPAVVVLDGAEHLSGQAGVLDAWGRAAPATRWLVTSRQALQLDRERVVPIGELPEEDAVALIRLRALERGVELGAEPLVAELARRLDGVPLALELAAGRLGVLGLAEVLDRLSLSLLRSGAPGRGNTLEDVIAWSHQMLDPAEVSALRQLAVFRGGFTPDAAAEVVRLPEGVSVPSVVESLVDRSLVAVRDGRLRLLAPVLAFASLAADPEAERRHGATYARLGDRASLARLVTDAGASVRRELAAEVDNVVIACRRALARQDADVAGRTALAAAPALELTGPLRTLAELTEAALALPGAADPANGPVTRRLRVNDAALAVMLGGEPGDRFEGAVRACREAGDAALLCQALNHHGRYLANGGRTAEADAAYAEAAEVASRIGDRATAGVATGNRGLLLDQEGRLAEARARYTEGLTLVRAVRHRGYEGSILGNLARIAYREGRLAECLQLLEQSLAALRDMGDLGGVAHAGTNLGILLATVGRGDEAEPHLLAARPICEQRGELVGLARVRQRLGLLAATRGRVDAGRAELEAALGLLQQAGAVSAEAVAWLDLAVVETSHGSPSRAVELAERAEGLFRRVGDPTSEHAARARAAVARGLEGASAGAVETTAEVVGALRGSSDRLRLAGALVCRAAAAALAGDPSTADAALDEAAALGLGAAGVRAAMDETLPPGRWGAVRAR